MPLLLGSTRAAALLVAVAVSLFVALSSRTASAAPPASPEWISAIEGNLKITASWYASTGATQYTVQKSTSANSGFTDVAGCVGISATTCTVAAHNGTPYYLRIKAANAANQSSAYTAIGPRTPFGLPSAIVAKGSTSKVRLEWTACAGCASYRVKRSSTSGGTYNVVGSPTGSWINDSTVANGSNYYYVVTSRSSEGTESAPSAPISASPLARPKDVAAFGDTSKILVTWDPTPNATGYVVRRSTTAGSGYTTVGTPGNTIFYDTLAVTSTKYHYVVAATRGTTNLSDDSLEVSAGVYPQPAPPSGVMGTPGVDVVALRRDLTSDDTTMRVERSTDGVSTWTSTPCGATASNACIATGLAHGTPYWFRMFAVNANGLSSYASAIVGPIVPLAGWGPGDSGSVRLMNAPIKCREGGDDDAFDMRFDTRMARIVDIIRKEDPDVVAFQEVFEEECRTGLLARLSNALLGAAPYPNYVVVPQAGLLLVSKLPFEKYDHPAEEVFDEEYDVPFHGSSDGTSFREGDDYVATAIGESHVDSELFRGEGEFYEFPSFMVRIRPPGGRPANVAVTDFPDAPTDGDRCIEFEHQQARRNHIEDIASMIDRTLEEAQRRTEPVFLLGVFDIDGNRAPSHVTDALDLEEGAGSSSNPGGACHDEDGECETVTVCVDEDIFGTCHAWNEQNVNCHGGKTPGIASRNDDFEHGEWERVFDNHIEPEAAYLSSANNCFIGGCDTEAESFFMDSWGFEHPSWGEGADWGQNDMSPLEDHETLADIYLGQTSADAWHPLTMQSGHRGGYILHNQPSDRDLGPYLSATRLRRVFYYDPDGAPQFYSPATYESFDGNENGSGGSTLAFDDDKAVSDHYFLVGDFLFSRPARSNPLPNDGSTGPIFGSEVVAFGSTQDRTFPGVLLEDPRQSSWFYLTEAGGTVTVGSNLPDEVEVEVFHPSDLSTPIPAFHQMTSCFGRDLEICGDVMDLPSPPYFVRFSVAAGATAPIEATVGFHLHRCSDPVADFCVLPNGDRRKVTWPTGAFNTPYSGTAHYDDEMYFVAAVDEAASRAPVSFRIELGDTTQFDLGDTAGGRGAQLFPFSCGFDADLPDCGSGSCNAAIAGVGSWPTQWDDDDGDGAEDMVLVTGNESSGALSPKTPGTPRPVLLRVHRKCSGTDCIGATMNVEYDSHQFRVVPETVRVIVENDFGANDDEVYMSIALDGPSPGAASCDADPPPGVRLPYMDPVSSSGDGDTAPRETSSFGKYETNLELTTFNDHAHITFCDSDGDSPNDFLGALVVTNETPSDIPLLADLVVGDVDSQYWFSYLVRREAKAAEVEACSP